jgi:hypothetical protein
MPNPIKYDLQWAKAKQVCRLNMEEIQLAKELGLSPKTLMKNQPSPSQQWKLPVKLWICELHTKRFGSRAPTVNRPAQQSAPSPHPAGGDAVDADIPF